MAAALTYHTLFSILPTIALILVALHAYVGPEEQVEFKDAIIEWILRPVGSGEEAVDMPHITGGEVDRRQQFEDARQLLELRLERTFKYLERIDFSGIGLVGLLIFIWGATALVVMVERIFNSIYRASRHRRWHRRLTLYYSLITLGPITIMAGIWLRSELFRQLESGSLTGWLAPVLVVASPFMTTWLALFLLYVTVPNTRVRARSAAVGSLIAAVLSGIALGLFRMYISHAAVTTLYGALALIPLSLLWLYLSWLIILFGLELTHTLQTFPGRDFDADLQKRESANIVDPSWALLAAIQVARRFETGEVATVGVLEASLDQPQRVIQRLLGALESEQVLMRVETDSSSGYSLTRPAQRIELSAILRAAQQLRSEQQPPPGEPAVKTLLDELHSAEEHASREKTLADFIDVEPGQRTDAASATERSD